MTALRTIFRRTLRLAMWLALGGIALLALATLAAYIYLAYFVV